MKPCDCEDSIDANKLNEQGISFGMNSIEVKPCVVILSSGSCTMTMTQNVFERLARWYLEDQSD